MASLQNLQIDQSYPGLIKTNDQAAVGATLKALEDGAGNTLPIEVSTAGVNFTGTVTGVDTGVQSIVAGTNVTVDNTDPANPIVSASGGGGGGADLAEGQNITPALGGGFQIWSIPWILSGYSKGSARAFGGNDMMLVPFYAKAGETIDDFYFRIQTAQAGALMNVALYKSYVATVNTNQKVLMPEYVATIATNVDVSTTGKKSFTGLAQSLPSDSAGGMYWIGFLCDTALVQLTKWSSWVAAERVIYNDIYRGNGLDYNVGSMTIPTGQLDVSSAGPTTDLPVDFAWTYQS